MLVYQMKNDKPRFSGLIVHPPFMHRSMGYRVKGGSLSSHLELTEYMIPSSAKELGVMHQELKRLSTLYHHISHGPLALYDEHEVAGWQRKLEAALERYREWYYPWLVAVYKALP